MSLTKEFKEFAMRGSVIDLAVGIIIGAAFGKIVSSLVADVIMPPIGILVGGIDFTDLAVLLKQGATADANVYLRYGKFLQSCVDFIIVAWSIFMVIKGINTLKRKQAQQPAAPAAPPADVVLLTEIRDLLKSQR
ncbi:MAG: large-conductance mechanosensitive channel protein MscL [Bacteroidota bacterium]